MSESDHGLDGDGLSQLWAAGSVAELQQLLVTRSLSAGSGRHAEAVELFAHHHGAEPDGAVDTAVLLCTDWRWRRCTAPLIVGICATGMLGNPELDELAGRLLWPDRPQVCHPLSWLGLEWTALDLSDGTVIGRGVDREQALVSERSPTRPPLLRWSAGHLLSRQRTDLGRLARRADLLDSQHGPSVVAGVLDAVDSLSDDDARRAVDLGLASSRAQVRTVALRIVADRVGRTEAVRRAQADPDASVRRWASELNADETPTTLF